MQPNTGDLSAAQVMTLEAFADTIIPGERRHPDDRAIADASPGGGAVASGAVDLMLSEEGGIAGMLDSLAEGLNDHAVTYAKDTGRAVDDRLPAFVALSFNDRTDLVRSLVAPAHPEHEMWVSLAMFTAMAWDTGASMHTVEAMDNGHPGLLLMGFTRPDPDGLWRFPDYSYRRALARTHPRTTTAGDPA